MAGKKVGIEIGSISTKIVVAQETRSGLKVKDFRIVPNSEKAFGLDGYLNMGEIIPSIKSALKDMKVGNRVSTSLSVASSRAVVRTRELPAVRMKDMKEMVKFEADQFLPYESSAFYIDFRVNSVRTIRTDAGDQVKGEETTYGDGEKLAEVMIVAVPKEDVDDQVELIDKLKLKIERVDHYSDAVFSYVKHVNQPNLKNTMVLDVGERSTKMTMIQGDQYFANIMVETGIEDLITTYAEQNVMTRDNAEASLFESSEEMTKEEESIPVTPAVEEGEDASPHDKLAALRNRMNNLRNNTKHVNPIDSEVPEDLERVYENIAYEVGKMIEFFRTRQFGMRVDEIVLIGGGANLKHLSDYIAHYHNVVCRRIGVDGLMSGIPYKDANRLVPAIGSMLKGE